ncbi:hypothetical protein [Nitratifractor salsuginis]|uniref:Uncharacterized protein n=1 Tax=Nitratifractor salsuginis (strain DSM 16511 / JCM 12458 / E9I37-1) TaxID=749222 RepID=E6X285_NITSE|nr:hypothetical protein [Nitratifractor salsuginis]ADV46020.1 hypothetical protein Nitsa_0753 [Nitratifractor salsuginis DSM 16511]
MIQPSNKEAINIAANFFKGNVALSLAAIAILVTLALLQYVPFLGLAFALAYAILSFEVQVYVARQIPEASNSEEMADVAARTRLGDLLTRHLDIAAGGMLGYFTISMVLGLIFMMMFSATVDVSAIQGNDMQAFVAAISTSGAMGVMVFFLLILLFLSYIFPGVTGEVMAADGFGPAFMKTFLLFSPKFWKRTFNKDYFLLILLWSVIVFVAAVVLSWFTVSILLIPIALIGAYFLSLYNAAVYFFARELLS